MPQPVTYNTGTNITGSIQAQNISYVVDGEGNDYRTLGGKTWHSEIPAVNQVVFSTTTANAGKGPANSVLYFTSATTSSSDIISIANSLPGSPHNFTDTASVYQWAAANGWFVTTPSTPFESIVTDNLVFYVNAYQLVSYPTTGSIWYDISGNGNNFTPMNNMTFTNYSFDFNGVDSGLQDTISSYNPDSANSVLEILFKPMDLSREQAIFSDNYGPEYGFWIHTNGNLKAAAYTSVYGTLQVGRWYHAIMNVTPGATLNSTDQTYLQLYLNGQYIGQNNTNTGNGMNDQPFTFGYDYRSGSPYGYFSGSVATTRIYYGQFDQSKVLQNYYGGPIVTDGLVLAVDAGNLVSYESGSITTYPLTSSINGTLTNGTSFNPNNGGYWEFDGVDDYITWGDNFDLTTTSISGFVWGWANSLNNYLPWIDKLGNNGNYRFHATSLGQLVFGIRNTIGTYEQMVTNTLITTNTWYYLGFTFNNSTREGKIYLNGNLKMTNTFSIDRGNTFTSLQTGYQANNGGTLNGRIATLSLYNKELTADEVLQNYIAQKQKYQP